MMKWIVAGLAVIGTGMVAYFSIMFYGPHMNVQQHILGYQQWMPLPPKGMVPVEQNPYAVPPAKEAAGMKNPLPDTPANRERGRVYYSCYCIFCHGENGQGDGPVGYSYMPRLRTFTRPESASDVGRRSLPEHAARHRA